MAEGVRVRPRAGVPIPDNALVAVTDHARPLRPPADGTPLDRLVEVCRFCGTKHFAKTYHIQLTDGSAIVSTGVWDALQRLRTPAGELDNPFESVNPVRQPPSQGLVLPPARVSVTPTSF